MRVFCSYDFTFENNSITNNHQTFSTRQETVVTRNVNSRFGRDSQVHEVTFELVTVFHSGGQRESNETSVQV